MLSSTVSNLAGDEEEFAFRRGPVGNQGFIRPVNDTLVLMLPLCADLEAIGLAVAALQVGLDQVIPIE